MRQIHVMFTMLIYLILVLLLAYWVESSHVLPTNPLISRRNPASELEDWLKKFHWGHRHQGLSSTMELPKYKFYTEVIEVILHLSRKLGGSFEDSLLEIREGLICDQRFEKKVKETVMGTWLQMALMLILTWAFITGSIFITEIKFPALNLFFIALWQITGLGVLPWLLRYFRRKYFSGIGKVWKILFVLRSLERVPLARSESLNFAGVSELAGIQQKSLSHIVEKLQNMCERIRRQGGSYREELEILIEELRFQEKWHFDLFEKRLTVIKLGILSVFFLPSYLAFIFLLLGDLMDLM